MQQNKSHIGMVSLRCVIADEPWGCSYYWILSRRTRNTPWHHYEYDGVGLNFCLAWIFYHIFHRQVDALLNELSGDVLINQAMRRFSHIFCTHTCYYFLQHYATVDAWTTMISLWTPYHKYRIFCSAVVDVGASPSAFGIHFHQYLYYTACSNRKKWNFHQYLSYSLSSFADAVLSVGKSVPETHLWFRTRCHTVCIWTSWLLSFPLTGPCCNKGKRITIKMVSL